VTVGEALAEARDRAGLTVDELSDRTRIREAVIRGIERDDYAACGGDIYARGYVRAIAGAVGIDAQPLIRDFDATRAGGAGGAVGAASAADGADAAGPPNEFAQVLAGAAITTLPQPVLVADPAPAPEPDPAPEPEPAPEPDPAPEPPTVVDMLPVAADPELTVPDPEVPSASAPEFPIDAPSVAAPGVAPPGMAVTTGSTVTPSVAVIAAMPSLTGQPSAWRARLRGRGWVTSIAILVVLALAVAGFASSRIVGHLRQHTLPGNAAAELRHQKAPDNASRDTGTKTPGAASNTNSTASRKAKAHKAHKAPQAGPVHWLPIRQAMAFGPDGTVDGDNPQGAEFAITSHAPSPWQTNWYASPMFGLLKSGTGLLLDMGKTVTITSVRIDLSPYRGADLQLRLGRTAGGLRLAARADDTGGSVRLRLRSAQRARYVLIWFTLLPPDGAGTYQESVYRIVVNGRL
jgi:transcriptional regulator with XRE-family HTH domain